MSSARKAKTASTSKSAGMSPELDSATGGDTATMPPLPVNREDLAYYVRHHLSQTERMVIMLRYAEELEFEEIASVLKVEPAEVEQIHRTVVGRLKKALISCEELATV